MLNSDQLSMILPGWHDLVWYYSIELSPGVYTKGFEFNNIALTRKMLGNLDLRGTTAIDFSAMEGSMSIVMSKQGAEVLSTDTIDRSEQISLASRAHGVKFNYYPEVPLHRFAEHVFELQTSKSYIHGIELGAKDQTNFGFDVVLSSGVMYHVMNPVDHFMSYRKLCKLGGLVVLETAASISDEVSFQHAMRPNSTLYNGFATWFVSIASIDLFLRACYLQPLAFCFVSREKNDDVETARVGVVARAVSKQAFDPNNYRRFEEVWKSELYNNKDFSTLQPAAQLTGSVSKKLDLGMNGLHSAECGLSVAAFDRAGPLPFTRDDLRLSL